MLPKTNDLFFDVLSITACQSNNVGSSMSAQQGLINFSQKRNAVKADKAGLIGDERLVKIEGASLEVKDWGTINYKGQGFVLDLLATPSSSSS